MKSKETTSPRCSGDGMGTVQEGGESTPKGWGSSRNVNKCDGSWQAVAARRSIERSWSMLGMQSRFSGGGEGAPSETVRGVEWEDASAPEDKVCTAASSSRKEQKKNNQIIILVFCVMFLLEVFVNFDSGVIPAILVTLQKTFDIDGAGAGILGSLPYIGLVASSPFVGRGLTTFSPKWFCFITMVVNLFATGLLGLAVHKWMLFLSRLVIGLSQAGFSIYAPVWVDQFAPAEKLTLWMGLAQGGVVVGTMLGCILAGTFDSAVERRAENGSGWRYALLIQAIGLFLLLVAWIFLPRRFVDINMHQPNAGETLVASLPGDTPPRDAKERGKGTEEEEQATGVEGAPDSPQKDDAVTTRSILRIGSLQSAPGEMQKQNKTVQQEQQQPPDTVLIISPYSVTSPGAVELSATVAENDKKRDETLAATEQSATTNNAATAATDADIGDSRRRRSLAGIGSGTKRPREGAQSPVGGEAGEERRWSAFAGVAPGALFGRKANKRPSTAAAALTIPAQGGAAQITAYRPSSKALSDGGAPSITNGQKAPIPRTGQTIRCMPSGDTINSNEGLPQFRRNFVSNLLPLDFIATSPTFARRSSQLHPGPAPGAAAAAAAGMSSSSNSSSSSSSSVGSPAKEGPRSGVSRGPATASGVHRSSNNVSRAVGGLGGIFTGAGATAAQRKKQLAADGNIADQLRYCAGPALGEELKLPAATENSDIGAPQSPGDDRGVVNGANADQTRLQQPHRGGFIPGSLERPAAHLRAAFPVAAEPRRESPTRMSSVNISVDAVASDSHTISGASEDAVGAVRGGLQELGGSSSRSQPTPPDNGVQAMGPPVAGTADSTGCLSTAQQCEAEPATFSPKTSRAAPPAGVHSPDAADADSAVSGDSGCFVRGVTPDSDQQKQQHHVNGRRKSHNDTVSAVIGKFRRASAGNGVADTGGAVPGGPAITGVVTGGAPAGGINEVQYQRIFMTPHATTLAFEAFNWAAGVGDPLLYVRDTGRHQSLGGGPGGSGTALGGGFGSLPGTTAPDAAHPVQGARRRESTTGANATVFTRSTGRLSLVTGGPTLASRKTVPLADSAEPPTVAGDGHAVTGDSSGLGVTVEASDRIAAGEKPAAPDKEVESLPQVTTQQDKVLTNGGEVAKGGGGQETEHSQKVADLEDAELLCPGTFTATTAGAAGMLPREAPAEQLHDRPSAVLTEASAATITGETRTFDVWESIRVLFSSPLYICVTISLCALFFEVTAIQFWSISYFEQEMKVPKGQVLVAFNVTAATGPILGVLAGGWFIDYVGGYKTERGMMKTLLILGAWASLCLIFGTCACVVSSFVATIIFIWGILFFGGGILPAATGIVIASVPLEVRAFGSGFCMMIYNVFGYVLGTAVPGAVVQAAGLQWGMRMVFLWSIFGVGGLYGAAFVVWRLRIRPSYYICTYGNDQQDEGEAVSSKLHIRSSSGLQNAGNSVTADAKSRLANETEVSCPAPIGRCAVEP